MTVRILKSTDAGAPAIGQSLGSIETLLDAVLVNGYGSKPPLGWSVFFRNSATGRKYYRQGAGSTGRVLTIQDTAQNAYAYPDFLAVVGLAHPASIGVEPVGTIGMNASFGINRPENYWEVIGNESFFYLLSGREYWGGQMGLRSIFACGDIASYAENDLGCALIATVGKPNPNYSVPANEWSMLDAGVSYNSPINTGRWDMAGGLEGMGMIPSEQLARYLAPPLWDNLNFPGISRVLPASPLLVIQIEDQNNRSIRGEFPGLRMPLMRQASYRPAPFSEINGKGRDAGKTFMAVYGGDLNFSSSVRSWIMIETSDTW